MLLRGSGPASGRFPEFRRLCGRFQHKTGGLAGMIHSTILHLFLLVYNLYKCLLRELVILQGQPL